MGNCIKTKSSKNVLSKGLTESNKNVLCKEEIDEGIFILGFVLILQTFYLICKHKIMLIETRNPCILNFSTIAIVFFIDPWGTLEFVTVAPTLVCAD